MCLLTIVAVTAALTSWATWAALHWIVRSGWYSILPDPATPAKTPPDYCN